MRIGVHNGRTVISVTGGTVWDVEDLGGGRYLDLDGRLDFRRWPEFIQWARGLGELEQGLPATGEWDAPIGPPPQIFAIGLNYIDHAAETSMAVPVDPVVFTKFSSSMTGPVSTVEVPADGNVDWEVELAVVIGRGGRNIPIEAAWRAVAGLTLAQDLSERRSQLAGSVPQFSLAKSFAGFLPLGPHLVTPDGFDDPEAVDLTCILNDTVVQSGTTADMIFSIPELIARLSAVVELKPGDLILTGTPPGVGLGRTPQVYIQPGDRLLTRSKAIGELVQTFTT